MLHNFVANKGFAGKKIRFAKIKSALLCYGANDIPQFSQKKAEVNLSFPF
jgi:hypothetical protein